MPIEFGAEDWFNAGGGGSLGEFDGAVEVIFIGQSDGRELMTPGKLNNGFGRKRGVEKRIIAVNVKRSEKS